MNNIATEDGYIYCKIQKGMYGLPQAGIIAQELLKEHLSKHGYLQSKIRHGLWKHKTRSTCFTLVVDDFAVKYIKNDQDAEHLISTLKQDCNITIDQEATKYICLTIELDFDNNQVDMHMLGYFGQSPHLFQTKGTQGETKLTTSTRSPKLRSQRTIHQSGKRLPPLPQPIRCEIHPSSHRNTALIRLSSRQHNLTSTQHNCKTKQAKPTAKTMATEKQLLDYCALQEEAIMTFKASDMVLQVHSNAGYANKKKIMQPGMGAFFPLKQRHILPQ